MKRESIASTAHDGNNSSGTASVVFGLLGILFSLLIPIGGAFCSISAIIFGAVQRKSSKNRWANWGLALGIAGLVISIVIFILAYLQAARSLV